MLIGNCITSAMKRIVSFNGMGHTCTSGPLVSEVVCTVDDTKQ